MVHLILLVIHGLAGVNDATGELVLDLKLVLRILFILFFAWI